MAENCPADFSDFGLQVGIWSFSSSDREGFGLRVEDLGEAVELKYRSMYCATTL